MSRLKIKIKYEFPKNIQAFKKCQFFPGPPSTFSITGNGYAAIALYLLNVTCVLASKIVLVVVLVVVTVAVC